MNKQFNPYRRFLLILASLTVFSTIILSSILSVLIEKHILEETVEITQYGVENHFMSMIPNLFNQNNSISMTDSTTFNNVKKIIKMHFDIYGIEETKFIQPDGEIYFSYNKNEIGSVLPNNETIAKAFNNERIRKKFDATHLHIWLPIVDDAGKVKQVVFVERNISIEMKEIRHIQRLGVLVIVLVFLIFYLLLRQVFIHSTNKIQLAFHDPLTNLPNRRLFINHLNGILDQAKKDGRMSAVMFLDLNRFKHINDTLGHDIGDALLIAVGERLSQLVCREDMVARFGGDEFMLSISKISCVEDSIEIAQKIVDVFSIPFKIENHELNVLPSIGIAICPYHGQDAETLIKHADTAMYFVKRKSINNYKIYEENMAS